MRKRVFFSDLDETLLNSKKEISPATRRALEDFLAAGNYFAISTGRAMESAMAVRNALCPDFPHTFVVAYNGAQIYDCDRQ